MGDIIAGILLVALWLAAPPLIAREKGRRWWVWLIITLLFPGPGLILALFIHPVKKDGTTSIS